MTPGKGLEGATEAADGLGRMGDAARDELAVDLAIIGRDYLALQQVRVAKDTGALEAALGVQLLLDRLRVRVGLVGKANRQTFVGRIIEFGRYAQTVLVQRRRRVNGTLRTARMRKRVEDIVATYRLNVKPEPARPFVRVPDADLDAMIAQHLADFWGRTFTRAGI